MGKENQSAIQNIYPELVQFVRTPVLGTGGREFKSLIPDQSLKELRMLAEFVTA